MRCTTATHRSRRRAATVTLPWRRLPGLDGRFGDRRHAPRSRATSGAGLTSSAAGRWTRPTRGRCAAARLDQRRRANPRTLVASPLHAPRRPRVRRRHRTATAGLLRARCGWCDLRTAWRSRRLPPRHAYIAELHAPHRHAGRCCGELAARQRVRQRHVGPLPQRPRPVVASPELHATASGQSNAPSVIGRSRRRRRRDDQRPDGRRTVLPARAAIPGAPAVATAARSERRRAVTPSPARRSDPLAPDALEPDRRMPISAPGIASSAVTRSVS